MTPVLRWIDAPDGWRLAVTDVMPEGPARGVVIAGHAMMVDGRTLWRADRPSLAGTLAARGFRVLVPDLRGHGLSGPTPSQGGRWSYADLVADVPRYVALARALEPRAPVVLLGNSLFGHLALVWLGRAPDAGVRALVGLAVNIWGRRWTATRTRWWLKRALAELSVPLVRRVGRLPVRRLGLGSADESAAYWLEMARWVLEDRWGARDDEYTRAMARVDCPVLMVTSEGDRLLAHPDDAALFTRALGHRRELWCVGPGSALPSLRSIAPGHVGMVRDPSAAPLWDALGSWIAARCA
jgi:predicted alpha/beta hydrolase